MNKALFRRLLKAYHPDTTTRKKATYGELTRHILSAADDEQTLRKIESLGEGYLEVVKAREAEAEEGRRSDAVFEEVRRRFNEMQAEDIQVAYAIPLTPPPPDYWRWFLCCLNPYFLTLTVCEWRNNGRALNTSALISGVFWMGVWWKIWVLISALEGASHAAGYSHGAAVGPLFILAKGGLILWALPLAIPLGLLAVVATICGGVLWAVAWILGGILCLFHPWLAFIPYAAAIVIFLLAGWEALGEDF